MRATGFGDPPQRLSGRAALLLVGVAALARTHALLEPDGIVLGWRQADMLSVARNYFRNGFHLFFPQIDWSGAGPGFLEMELPRVTFTLTARRAGSCARDASTGQRDTRWRASRSRGHF